MEGIDTTTPKETTQHSLEVSSMASLRPTPTRSTGAQELYLASYPESSCSERGHPMDVQGPRMDHSLDRYIPITIDTSDALDEGDIQTRVDFESEGC